MCHDGQQLGTGTVERRERLELLLSLSLEAPLLHRATEQSPDCYEELDLFRGEPARLDGLDVDDTGYRIVPWKRYREHRHELRLVEARYPFEAGIYSDVRRCHRPADECRPTGQSFAGGHRDKTHLIEIQAVRGSKPQDDAITIHQVDRADLDIEGVCGAVDDCPHQLVPVSGGGQQLGKLVEEGELAELALGVERRIYLGPVERDLTGRALGLGA